MRFKVETTLGKLTRLPCNCTRENPFVGQYRVQWLDPNSTVFNLSGKSFSDRFVHINERRRMKIAGDCSILLRRARLEDQGNFK